jgi:hypothetical protein
MKDLFLESFIGRKKANTLPSRNSRTWLDAAAEVRLSSTTLTDAFECTSTADFGKSIGDTRIVFAARKLYIKVLNALQRALQSPSESRSSETMFAISLLAQFEVRAT